MPSVVKFQTNFKPPRVAGAVRSGLRRRLRDRAESDEKFEVRRRDQSCRFPMCGCRRFGLTTEVSHNEHKGMGGNPTGDRSDRRLMMLLCQPRHRIHSMSIHAGSIAWKPLDRKLGADGPVAWLIDLALLRYYQKGGEYPKRVKLTEVARETRVGSCEPLTPDQVAVFAALARMEL